MSLSPERKREIVEAIANPQRPTTETIVCRDCGNEWETKLTYIPEPGGCGVIWQDKICPKCGSTRVYAKDPC